MSINTSSNNTSGTKKITQDISPESLNEDQIRELVEEKLEYLKWLIRYSKARNLKLVPSPKGLNTFACGLSEEAEKIAGQYIEGKIEFSDIPKNILKPSIFYYDLKMLLEADIKSLGAIGDHELGHAEFTDYFDIFWINKEASDRGLSSGKIALFFNAVNEDPFIGRQIAKKGMARKNMVEHLYKTISQAPKDEKIDISNNLKLDQLKFLMQYYWLKTDFPKSFQTKIIVAEDIQNIFDKEILPHFARMISPDIPNFDRTVFKNSILFPIIEKLAKEDQEEIMKMQKMMQDILNKIMDEKKGDSEKNDESGEKGQKSKPQNNPKSPGKGNTPSEEDLEKMLEDLKKDPEKFKEAMQQTQKELENMSPEEIQKLQKQVIKQMNKESLEKLNEEMPGIDWTQNEEGELEFKPKEIKKEDQQKAESFQKKLEKTIEKHEEEIKKSQDLQKQISSVEKTKDLKDLVKEVGELKSKKLKKDLQESISNKLKSIEEQRQRELQNMIEQGFNMGEEDYYKKYIKLEAQIEPYVDDFIKSLISYIPKLKEYFLEGNYHSGTVYDIPKAGRKVMMGHYDIYGRKDERKTMKINLGISLSLDVSGSMEGHKIEESLKLVVFLGLFCQKLKIPFYLNTIGESTKEIKAVNTDYTNAKGDIMRSSMHLENATNMTGTFNQVREVQIEQKWHNPNIEFLPIIITDGQPSDPGNNLDKVISEFGGLDLIFGLSLTEEEKQKLDKTFKLGKKVFLDDATEILTKGQIELIDYLVSNKDRIFKMQD